ncbi:PQ-loop-domain-containing protein [Lichtheimia hyalospora FSU 10163]|nr:PQ-loop-domain-containing protein [Lichtheimia hyalospora FSU 10163]
MQDAASAITGYISILCWIIVFTPQLWENYTRKSGEGLSMPFLIIWLAGDLFNLVGVVLQSLLPTMFVLALWYSVADIALIWQVLYYRRRQPKFLVVEEEINRENNRSSQRDDDETEPLIKRSSVSQDEQQHLSWRPVTAAYNGNRNPQNTWTMNVLFAVSTTLLTVISCYAYIHFGLSSSQQHSELDDESQNQKLQLWPQVFGWISAALYISSRMPQIIKNWKQQSTEGLSKLLFICAVCGNVFYTASIFLRSVDPYYLLINSSWIIGSVGTLIFDFIIFIQFFLYKNHKTESQG